jgi:hypothetical protein
LTWTARAATDDDSSLPCGAPVTYRSWCRGAAPTVGVGGAGGLRRTAGRRRWTLPSSPGWGPPWFANVVPRRRLILGGRWQFRPAGKAELVIGGQDEIGCRDRSWPSCFYLFYGLCVRRPPQCCTAPASCMVIVSPPGHSQADDGGGEIGPQDQCAPFGQCAKQLGRQHPDLLVDDGAFAPSIGADDPGMRSERDLTTQLRQPVEGGWVADAAEDHFDPRCVPDGTCSGAVPAGFQLS